MVLYTCNDEGCARVFQQEPAYINHMLKHLNEGGEYLKDLTTKRKRKAKTPSSAALVEKKKSREDRQIQSAREEWEQRQKRRKEEADAAKTLPLPTQPARKRRRRKVFKTIASGIVGTASGQAEVVDLRSPSRSPSIECLKSQAGESRRFDVSPDTTVPSMSRDPTPGGVSDLAILSLHHLTSSLPSPISDNGNQSSMNSPRKALATISRDSSEEAVVAHHHSASTYSTPQASRGTSEEAVVAHHHRSALLSPAQVDQEMSEEAVVAFHHRSVSDSPNPQVYRGISEEAIVRHHHSSSSTPFRQSILRETSEQAVTAYHHMSASIGSDSKYIGQVLEQEVVRHHHSVSTSPQRQSPSDSSEESIIVHHHPSRTNAGVRETTCTNSFLLVQGSNPDILDSPNLPIAMAGTSLLQPFAFPSSAPPTSTIDQGFTFGDLKSRCQAGQPVPPTRVNRDDKLAKGYLDQSSQDMAMTEPSTPRSTSHSTLTVTHASDGPITPSRLGPTWKTETAPPSMVDEDEISELESDLESDDDVDEDGTPTPSTMPSHYRSRPLFRPSYPKALVASSLGALQMEEVDIDSDPDAWAFEEGIDPKQWDDARHDIYTSVALDDLETNDGSQSDSDRDDSGEEIESEEEKEEEGRDEVSVEGECGYRVFAGYSDLDFIESDQWDDRHEISSSQVSASSFSLLSPKRPTALEATLGSGNRGSPSYNKPASVSPGSSTGRVSAELDAPLSVTSRAVPKHARSGLASSYAFQYDSQNQSFDYATPKDAREPIVRKSVLKRDQVILALLQSGHVDLAQDVLRGGA